MKNLINLTCPICLSERSEIFKAKILDKYTVSYYYCQKCGFLQTEDPYWIEEAYTEAIAHLDTGIVWRNIYIVKKLTGILYYLFGTNGKYLDVGGGYGLLTRSMRDIGFDFYWSDPYCQNLFAKGFEGKDTPQRFSAITAFEVIEHVYNPIDYISKSLKEAEASTIIFSTELFQGLPYQPEDWWYYSFETGQHISFFQDKTLKVIAERLSLNYYSCLNIHIFTDKTLNPVLIKILLGKLSIFISTYVKKRLSPKLFSDRDFLISQKK